MENNKELVISLTWIEWENEFTPVRDEHGDFIELEFSETEKIQEALEGRVLWTILDCDGEQVIVNGYHYVNRMRYITTKNRWHPEDLIEVEDED